MTKKIFFGWKADKDKVEKGNLCVYKDNKFISAYNALLLSKAGICIFNEGYISFNDDNIIEFNFNGKPLPDWVQPLILDEDNIQRIPNQFMDLFSMECVRDLIYWWFEVYCHKDLSNEKKERIAKLTALNFHREKYGKFCDYCFNHPTHIKWNEEQVLKRKEAIDDK